MIPLSGRASGRASEPSRTRVDDDGIYGNFHGWRLGYLGLSRGRQFIGGRAMSVGAYGPHTTWWRDQGGRADLWCGRPTSPLLLPSRLQVHDSKIGTLAFMASNSENISRTTFLKPKTTQNRDRKSTRLNSSHSGESRMPSSA